MNKFQQTLWDDLMKLCKENKAFYYVDQERDDCKFRIFTYRLASYTDFLEPNALECRGHMFEITGEDDIATPIRLASLPLPKFFNLNENPFTMGLDLSEVVEIEDKADGSLITSYMTNQTRLRLKSKGSLHSYQAMDAEVWLYDQEELCHDIFNLTNSGFTVIMEWTSPDNRIVLGYEQPKLVVLSIRDNWSEAEIKFDDLVHITDAINYPAIKEHWSRRFEEELRDPSAFIESIPDMTGIEGFVVKLASGQRVKIKTTWYLALHHTKDSINCPRRLFEAVLEEATDDMRSLFWDDPTAIKMIADMEAFVEEKYNHLADTTTRFFNHNKHLSRKEYAILGQNELDRLQFSAAMMLFDERPPDFKAILKKAWKSFGFTDGNNSNQDS